MTIAAELLAAEPPQKRTKRGRPFIAARVPPDVYDRLFALSRLLRVGMSEIVREALEQRLKQG